MVIVKISFLISSDKSVLRASEPKEVNQNNVWLCVFLCELKASKKATVPIFFHNICTLG